MFKAAETNDKSAFEHAQRSLKRSLLDEKARSDGEFERPMKLQLGSPQDSLTTTQKILNPRRGEGELDRLMKLQVVQHGKLNIVRLTHRRFNKTSLKTSCRRKMKKMMSILFKPYILSFNWHL
jgi:hypothetical protein